MGRTPKVALLVETSRGYGRALLRGVVRYARLHGPWAFHLRPGDFEQDVPRLREWGGTGIIARIETPEVARAVLRAGVPTIALDLAEAEHAAGHPLSRLGEVASDSRGAARLAAEHLLERGFRHFAFVGTPGRVWSDRREAAFVDRLRESGCAVAIYRPPGERRGVAPLREQPHLARWLAALPRPAGVMACHDDRGREVLEACRVAGLAVPDEVAVIGVDNDELLCELADPPLSSVALDAEMGGYRAAELLDGMMRGKVRSPRRLLVEPLHVVARRSTDVVAPEDPEIAAAVRFIHDHAAEGIGVADVVADRLLSRRALEIRFRKALGRSPHEEIQRVRLERARRLLRETDLAIPRVAEAAGYGRASYLAQVFRQHLGTTPARYRRRHRT
jgi:LacI family transcriptional regulator